MLLIDFCNLQQQKSYGGFRELLFFGVSLIYNSRNLMVALEIYDMRYALSSTTVEILWWLQSFFFLYCITYLQQQKSYGGFRVVCVYLIRCIYNSRNLMVALEPKASTDGVSIYNSRNLMVALEQLPLEYQVLSTTVEILWWLQRRCMMKQTENLQQQKSYGGFRVVLAQRVFYIYNSRNLMVALETSYKFCTRDIYNSRNLMVALEYFSPDIRT